MLSRRFEGSLSDALGGCPPPPVRSAMGRSRANERRPAARGSLVYLVRDGSRTTSRYAASDRCEPDPSLPSVALGLFDGP